MRDRAAVLAREHDDRAWQAWMTVALGRAKKLLPLRRLLSNRMPRSRPRQSWQEQQRIMDQWVSVTRNPERLRKR